MLVLDKNNPPTIIDFPEGAILLVNKPLEWTSFDVVNKIRYSLRFKLKSKTIKVGHAGTLDPLATGLLIICVGKYTKMLDTFQGQPKQYTGTMGLGATTPSYDLETQPNEIFPTEHIDNELITNAIPPFLGDIDQLPPIFSAIKVGGQALYKKAREGKAVEVTARRIHIYDFKITGQNMPNLDFWVHCSKGTYIRSLAHDFGAALGSGAHLSALCRTQIGDFSLQDAWDLEPLLAYIRDCELVVKS